MEIKIKDHIEFDPSTHKYRNVNTDNTYTSITTWIGNHSHKFVPDKDNTAKTMRDLNMTYDEVVTYWAKKGKDSTDRGTYIHSVIESYFDSTDHPFDDRWYKEVPFEYLTEVKRRRCKKHIEDLLYLDMKGIAGQADLVLEYKNHIEIEDWKTNTKTIEQLKSFWYKTKYFKELFTELEQSDFNKYAIQLVFYGMMAEKYYGKPCKKHTINHIYNGFNQYVIDKKTVKYIKSKLQFLFD